MPHKQKRIKGRDNDSLFDLPPTHRAKPLPAGKKVKPSKSKNATVLSASYKVDDTPKAFARLLAFQTHGKGIPRALDDGNEAVRSKKRKRGKPPTETAAKQDGGVAEEGKALRIQPGERLVDFAVRVDQAMPISGLSTKGKKVEGMKERQSKHERKLRRLQDGWRKEEARIREKEEEEQEQAEEEWEEKLAGMDKVAREVLLAVERSGGRGKKRKKSKEIGEVDEDEGDPWEVLRQRRDAPKGIFDVVQAPPRFEKIPREIFKASDVKDVPREAGSLRRREELGATRADIISRYRAMMAAKRAT